MGHPGERPLLRSHHELAGLEGRHWRGTPHDPLTSREYQEAGLPWFDWYGGDREALEGAKKLADLKTVKGMGEEKGEHPLPENESVEDPVVITLGGAGEGRPVAGRRVLEPNAYPPLQKSLSCSWESIRIFVSRVYVRSKRAYRAEPSPRSPWRQSTPSLVDFTNSVSR